MHMSGATGTLPDNYLAAFTSPHAPGIRIGGNKLHGSLPSAWGLAGIVFEEVDLSNNAFNGA
jgi:hypothetical protein